MIGTTMDEIKEKVYNGHEVEFVYLNCEYSIEPDFVKGVNVARIWKCDITEPKCVSQVEISTVEDIELLLNDKCFNGKSFYNIQEDVIVETIF